MTPADKLRELLATRPAQPTTEDLFRWWRAGGELVAKLLDEQRRFPIIGGPSILWSTIAPYEAQLQKNHGGQNLETLAARGGLAPCEVWCAVHGKRLFDSPEQELCDQWFRDWRDLHEGLLADRDRFIAALRREQTVCAHVRAELDRERAQHKAQLAAAHAAARKLVAHIDDLGAFVDDNDPRVMATAGPIGAAQADLWVALGLDLDAEHARLQADIESRCAVCGLQMADPVKNTAGYPCRPGVCSQRPQPERLYAPERAKKEAEELHERALRNGMPPSGRWA